jgi:hypothetical protein
LHSYGQRLVSFAQQTLVWFCLSSVDGSAPLLGAERIALLGCSGLISFSANLPKNAAPVPTKLVVETSAEQVEHDAAEAKFSNLVLHMTLIHIVLCY